MRVGIRKFLNNEDLGDILSDNPEQIKIYNVFLVEDEEDLRKLNERVLISFGYRVIDVAKNGIEAVEKYKEFGKKPDIILMDYQMPAKNGLEAGKQILEIDPSAKVLIYSANMDIKKEVISNGMDFISKSASIKDLLLKLQKIVE